MKEFGLIGNPLGHSMSKIIHEEFMKIKNIDGKYSLREIPSYDKIKEGICDFKGFNVTIPYKRDIIDFLYFKNEKVSLYNACNTVLKKDSKLYGYNTDCYGFLNTLKKENINLKGKKVLLSGAGGVASVMAVESLISGANLYVSVRNREKGEKFIEECFNKTGKKATFVKKEELINYNFDCYFNGTPLGMYPNNLSSYIPLNVLKNIPFVFDTIYNPIETLTMKVSKYFNNKAVGGLYMLIYQAVEAQKIFNDCDFCDDDIELIYNKVKKDIPENILSKNLIIIGAPGSGKTTVGKEISKILSCDFCDIDEEIEKAENKKIPDIFKDFGESYFRNTERKIFEDSMDDNFKVISTGGGLPEFYDFKNIDREKNTVVFLDTDYDIILERLKNDNTRPLLSEGLEENLKKIIKRRYDIYNSSCDYKINISENNLTDIAVKTLETIKI